MPAGLDTWISYEQSTGKLFKRVVIGFAIVLSAVGVWLAVTGYEADRALRNAQQDIQAIKLDVSAGNLQDVRALSADLARQASRAHRLTTGPAWWLSSQLPYLGDPVEVVRGATTVVDTLAKHSQTDIVSLSTELNPSVLRISGNTLNLAAIRSATPAVDRLSAAFSVALRQLNALPANTWLGQLNRARADLAQRVSTYNDYVATARRIVTVLPEMAGGSTPKRYFIGLQNEAELRGTGGLPGDFAIMLAQNGKATFTKFSSDQALLPPPTQLVPTGLDFGRDYDQAWSGSQPTSQYVDSNVSPNFPYAAQIWSKMWEKVSGEHIDGAIALDPTALSYFLAVTGPATTANGTVVSADNVVSLTQRDVYTAYPDNAARKDFLVSLTKAVDQKLIANSGSAAALVQAGARAAGEHRFLVWFDDPAIERVIEQSSFAGAIPPSSQPFSAVILNNAAAGKLDYYVTRSITYRRTGCGATRDVLVTISLTNNAPTGLPTYVTGRIDSRAKYSKPGDDRLLVDYIATPGVQLLSVSLNGSFTTLAPLSESGHPMFRYDLELPRLATQTLEIHLKEPTGTSQPDLWVQPGVVPAVTSYVDDSCT